MNCFPYACDTTTYGATQGLCFDSCIATGASSGTPNVDTNCVTGLCSGTTCSACTQSTGCGTLYPGICSIDTTKSATEGVCGMKCSTARDCYSNNCVGATAVPMSGTCTACTGDGTSSTVACATTSGNDTGATCNVATGVCSAPCATNGLTDCTGLTGTNGVLNFYGLCTGAMCSSICASDSDCTSGKCNTMSQLCMPCSTVADCGTNYVGSCSIENSNNGTTCNKTCSTTNNTNSNANTDCGSGYCVANASNTSDGTC